jgi:hypothetical protein
VEPSCIRFTFLTEIPCLPYDGLERDFEVQTVQDNDFDNIYVYNQEIKGHNLMHVAHIGILLL